MNIITWEWFMIIGLVVGWLGILISKIIYDHSFALETLGTVIAVISSVSLLLAVILMIPLTLAQNKVEKEYSRYMEIKTEYYEARINYLENPDDDFAKIALDLAEQKVEFQWNAWYDKYKDDLNNEWHLWGTSSYAKKMDYIEVIEN